MDAKYGTAKQGVITINYYLRFFGVCVCRGGEGGEAEIPGPPLYETNRG